MTAADTHPEELYSRLTALHEKANQLRSESTAIRSRTAQVQEEAFQVRMRAQAIRDWAAAVRMARHKRPPDVVVDAPVRWFSVDGRLAGRRVSARWEAGRLTCDDRLLTQAQLLVDLGTVFVNESPPARVHATLTGLPASIMLTLAAACDAVKAIDFEPVAR